MVMRGPGIKPMSTFEHVASNVDVAPTLLGLAVRLQPMVLSFHQI